MASVARNKLASVARFFEFRQEAMLHRSEPRRAAVWQQFMASERQSFAFWSAMYALEREGKS